MGVVKYDIAESGLINGRTDYELSILLGVDSFTYLILDEDRLGRAYRSYDLDGSSEQWPLALQRLTAADELLREISFRRIHVGWMAGRTTLVPNRLFSANQRRAYLEQLTELELVDRIWSVPIESLHLQLVYALNNRNFDAAERRFNGGDIRNADGIHQRHPVAGTHDHHPAERLARDLPDTMGGHHPGVAVTGVRKQ